MVVLGAELQVCEHDGNLTASEEEDHQNEKLYTHTLRHGTGPHTDTSAGAAHEHTRTEDQQQFVKAMGDFADA